MRYVLVLRGGQASAYAIGRSRFDSAVEFDNSSDGHLSFCRYLAERKHSLFSIIVDSKDEEHHLEELPALKRSDQNRYLEKIVARHFPGDAISTVSVSGDQSGTGGKQATVSGLAKESDCKVWFDLLNDNGTLITDISSLSLLSLAMRQVSGDAPGLCAIQLQPKYFRVIGFHQKRLLISRHLIVSGDLSGLSVQLQQTRDYLWRVLSTAGDQSSADLSSIRIQVVGTFPPELVDQLLEGGIEVTDCSTMFPLLPVDRTCQNPAMDQLFVTGIASRKPKSARFSTGTYKSHFLARRIRHVFYAGAVASLCVTAVVTAASVHHTAAFDALLAVTPGSENVVTASASISNAADFGYTVDAVRDSMRIVSIMDNELRYAPLEFLSALASDLTAYPELEVTGIEWARLYDNTGGWIPVHQALADSSSTNEPPKKHNAVITGYLRVQPAERVATLGRFRRFVELLTESNRYDSVTVIEAPYGNHDNRFVGGNNLPAVKETFVIELSTGRPLQ